MAILQLTKHYTIKLVKNSNKTVTKSNNKSKMMMLMIILNHFYKNVVYHQINH
jgi:hypothetical protein